MGGYERTRFSTIEHGDDSKHIERSFDPVEIEKDGKNNEKLREAQVNILNPSFYRKFLEAMISIGRGNGPTQKIRLENKILSFLIDLSDRDIESTIRQFNIGFKRYVEEIKDPEFLTSDERRKIFENDKKIGSDMRGNIHESSIIGTIRFLKERKRLLDMEPRQDYGFYVQDVLDARYCIDLVECIFETDPKTGERKISIMGLIQLKSSKPSDEEIDLIKRNHKMWTESSVMDFNSFEKEYSDGLPDGIQMADLIENHEKISELLMDLCTKPEGFSADDFIKNLDLENLTNKHKAWLFFKYGKTMREELESLRQEGILDDDKLQMIFIKLDGIENDIKKKAKMPKNMSGIDTIKSIVAVGPNIIDESVIFIGDNKSKKIVSIK